jgi:uncharacterized protein (DUF1800 family)
MPDPIVTTAATRPIAPPVPKPQPTPQALIAHVLRRTTFGPFPGQVEALLPLGASGVVDRILKAPAMATAPAPPVTDDSSHAPIDWWLDRMANPAAGIHERMAWFWHGHLTTSHSKVFRWKMEFPQHLLIRANALGNFRTLLQKITIDPAMLIYLDGAWSDSDAPNENYSRELMELFCLGRGHYTQADVEAGARALAGYWVDWTAGTSGFHDYAALSAPVTYLGKPVKRAADVVNTVCDHPACPTWIATRIYQHLTGGRTSKLLPAWSRAFRASGMDIRGLVEAIVRHPTFLDGRNTRPRTPVEWVIPAMAALGLTDKDLRRDTLYGMGQLPFYPPNVAGWPSGSRWLSASFALARASLAVQTDGISAIAAASDPVAATLKRCSLYEVSTQTRTALTNAASDVADPGARATVLLALAVGSPEFALS